MADENTAPAVAPAAAGGPRSEIELLRAKLQRLEREQTLADETNKHHRRDSDAVVALRPRVVRTSSRERRRNRS
eukprot:SAG22_NODE_2502_length_2506_cov_1.695056_1_plen_73_part_10